MNFKRIIYALLYEKGSFYLSRNFRLQKVGDVEWLRNNFGFGNTCHHIDELMIILVSKNPSKDEIKQYFKDILKLKEKIFVPITLGGGIRNFNNAQSYFVNGADKILINHLAHDDHNEIKKISNTYGEQAISIMVDYKRIEGINYTFTDGATNKKKSLQDYLESLTLLNFGEIIINSIDKDGTASGFDVSFLKELPNNFSKPILIMGGAGKPEHFTKKKKKEEVTGLVTANLFNFLGNGLELARTYSINNRINLIKFDKTNI